MSRRKLQLGTLIDQYKIIKYVRNVISEISDEKASISLISPVLLNKCYRVLHV